MHIDDYMAYLKQEGLSGSSTQFRLWNECLKKNKVASVEALVKKTMETIRKNDPK